MPTNAAADIDETFHSHASFAASDDDELDFNPPKEEMSLAEQLAAQANKLKPTGGAASPTPVEKPASEMTLAE